MLKKKFQKLFAGGMTAALLLTSTMPVYAAGTQTITSDSTDKTATVSVTATVESSFQVKLPMSIELTETSQVEDYGPVFASPTYSYDSNTNTASGTYVGISGVLYGKYLNVTVKDSRPNSPYNVATGHDYELALGQATYNSAEGTYTVADESTDVYADVNFDYHKFYPISETSVPDGATNLLSSSSGAATNYPLDIRTKSKVTADGTTLYYGQITFTVEAVEY